MEITVNGKAENCEDSLSLSALLRIKEFKPERFALLVNGEVIPKGELSTTILKNGDQVEIIILAGGG